MVFNRQERRAVRVRGQALACALGHDISGVIAAVEAGRVAPVPVHFSLIEPELSRPYYLMPGTDPESQEDSYELFYQPLYEVVGRALADAGLSEEELGRLGVFFGSTSMDISIYESHYEQEELRDHFTQTSAGFGSITSTVARQFGIGGPCHTFTTACTSSANGLLYATSLIEQGELDQALIIGYDRFNKLGFYGFESLKLLSPTYYKPFDKGRDGIIMGEACGAVVLDGQGKGEGVTIVGGANTCDTHNVALHNTDGRVVAQVMNKALQAAGVGTEEIVAVKAHATGSFHNDLTESSAIASVFGNELPPVTGLKPYVGHTVGACGAVELIIYSGALQQGFLPKTPGFKVRDEELALAPLTENMVAEPGNYMLNFFGFGGNCTTLIVSSSGGS